MIGKSWFLRGVNLKFLMKETIFNLSVIYLGFGSEAGPEITRFVEIDFEKTTHHE